MCTCDSIQLLFLFERGKLKIQQTSVDAPTKTDMRCRRRDQRSLPSVVTCPTPPACCASASVHFTPNSRKLFSLMVTICADSSTCRLAHLFTDFSGCLTPFCYLVAKGDWCVYRRSYSLWHTSSFASFRQLSGVGVLGRSSIAIFPARFACARACSAS